MSQDLNQDLMLALPRAVSALRTTDLNPACNYSAFPPLRERGNVILGPQETFGPPKKDIKNPLLCLETSVLLSLCPEYCQQFK